MPSNHKGKGMKGRNYDELSGVGTSSAGRTGTMGNLNDAGHDGGVGTPDLADEGNLQSAAGQPGGTPAQGDSWRGYAGNKQSGPGDNSQRGSSGSQQSAEQSRGKDAGRKRAGKKANQDDAGTAGPSER